MPDICPELYFFIECFFILLNSLDTSQGLKDITVINIIKNDTKSLNMENFIMSKSASADIEIDIFEQEHQRYLEKHIERTINLLNYDNVDVGYISQLEVYFKELLMKDKDFLKELLSYTQQKIIDNDNLLVKFIEVVSNLNYEDLKPFNFILVCGSLGNKSIPVQEASVAAFEKWGDQDNVGFLRSVKYHTKWLTEYAENVISYLESC